MTKNINESEIKLFQVNLLLKLSTLTYNREAKITNGRNNRIRYLFSRLNVFIFWNWKSTLQKNISTSLFLLCEWGQYQRDAVFYKFSLCFLPHSQLCGYLKSKYFFESNLTISFGRVVIAKLLKSPQREPNSIIKS